MRDVLDPGRRRGLVGAPTSGSAPPVPTSWCTVRSAACWSPAGCPLPGEVNVANALAALAACGDAGLDVEAVAAGISAPAASRAGSSGSRRARTSRSIVDYAHKPDAVDAALRTLRPLTDGEVIIVLGAGGDRDPGKRRIMGKVAAGLADVLDRDRRQPAQRGPGRSSAGPCSSAPARCAASGSWRSATAARRSPMAIRTGPARRHRADRRQGARGRARRSAGAVHPFDDRDVARAALRARRGQRRGMTATPTTYGIMTA